MQAIPGEIELKILHIELHLTSRFDLYSGRTATLEYPEKVSTSSNDRGT